MKSRNLTVPLLLIAIVIIPIANTWADLSEIEAGTLISRVISGEDFVGRELLLVGTVLNDRSGGDRLVNVGTQETYNSNNFVNFISVYKVTERISRGQRVRMRVLIESSDAYNLGGQDIVQIEAVYKD